MKNSKLGCLDSMFSLQNILLRKMVYPLPATTFTTVQCQSIMSPILAQGLPLASFIQTFPHALIHGPLKFCGINIPNLFTEQTLAYIHTLLKFSNQPQDLTSFLLRASGKIMRLELGITGQLFEAPLILQDVITDSWMKSTWIATREANIHLMINILDFPLQWHGDKELVRVILQHKFCQPQLGALHQCRMFLQVLRISDICTGSREQILMGNWWNYKPLPSEYQWPKSVQPSPADWNTSELALATALNIVRQETLPRPLGNYFHKTTRGWFLHQRKTDYGSLVAASGTAIVTSLLDHAH